MDQMKRYIKGREQELKTSNDLFFRWLIDAINTESKILALEHQKNGSLKEIVPTKIYVKYPFPNENNPAKFFRSAFGDLEIIIDSEMKELMRVE